jgi:hypothetical protein
MRKMVITLASVMGCLALPLLIRTAFADPIGYYDPATLRRLCLSKTNNGTFLPQTPDSPVYVCLGKGGGMIICGGIGKYAKTCESGRYKRRVVHRRLKGSP